VRINSFGEFTRRFGGLWVESRMSYAVSHYFANGGRDAVIIRVADSAAQAAHYTLISGPDTLLLEAANPGTWGDRLQFFIDNDVADPTDTDMFNLTIIELDEQGSVITNEVFRNISVNEESTRYVVTILEQQSHLVRALVPMPDDAPTDSGDAPLTPAAMTNGNDGGAVGHDQIAHPNLEKQRQGIWALRNTDIFNILCIPPFDGTTDVDKSTWDAALGLCKEERAMLIVDPPSAWTEPDNAINGANAVGALSAPLPIRDENAAVYFPRVVLGDPLRENQLTTFAPCGIIAGIWARTDAARGVWKAPAGQEAGIRGVRAFGYRCTDEENGRLNTKGVNCLRTFPVAGPVVWGARTMKGADSLASEWKYIPVRRLALYMEESLYRGTQWVIFGPNDEPLWAQIRLNVGAFMHNLFRQGAFQGSLAREAYFVKCDSVTTTQNDIDHGIVNLEVGFAPLKPAEFLIIKISQIAGQVQA
jgi:hypothetical protein